MKLFKKPHRNDGMITQEIENTEAIIAPTPPKSITREEYVSLVDRLEFNETTRNNLLTFSFTAVLTFLGVILSMTPPLTPLICLLPYFLIIPFSARITYYRVSSAHIDSFLRCFSPENSVFRWGSTEVRERHNRAYGLIAWLVNHEMLLLSVVVGVAYVYQYCIAYGIESMLDVLCSLAALPLIAIVYAITDSTKSYKALYDYYVPKWHAYKNGTDKADNIVNKGPITKEANNND